MRGGGTEKELAASSASGLSLSWGADSGAFFLLSISSSIASAT